MLDDDGTDVRDFKEVRLQLPLLKSTAPQSVVPKSSHPGLESGLPATTSLNVEGDRKKEATGHFAEPFCRLKGKSAVLGPMLIAEDGAVDGAVELREATLDGGVE